MIFYLGANTPRWLSRLNIPLFVSHRRLYPYKKLPVALAPWALDSGGFSELSIHGKWITTEEFYVQSVKRYASDSGNLSWVAPQDWMCEPYIISKTGLDIGEHQRRTVESWVSLRSKLEVPVIPVLQGWEKDDYYRCIELYDKTDHSWRTSVVGLGSVCRRQTMGWVLDLVSELHAEGIRIHAFGFKKLGLLKTHKLLASSDSMAWSFHARKRPYKIGEPTCRERHKHCGACMPFALKWRHELLDSLENECLTE